MAKTRWAVDIIESERGWGRKVESTYVFADYDEALAFANHFNKDNTADTAPDWYMQAQNPRATTTLAIKLPPKALLPPKPKALNATQRELVRDLKLLAEVAKKERLPLTAKLLESAIARAENPEGER